MLNSLSFNTGGDMLNAFKQFGFRQSVAVAITAVGVACSAPSFAQGAAKAAANDEKVKQIITNTGSPIQFLDAPEFQKYVESDAKKLAEVVKKIGKVE